MAPTIVHAFVAGALVAATAQAEEKVECMTNDECQAGYVCDFSSSSFLPVNPIPMPPGVMDGPAHLWAEGEPETGSNGGAPMQFPMLGGRRRRLLQNDFAATSFFDPVFSDPSPDAKGVCVPACFQKSDCGPGYFCMGPGLDHGELPFAPPFMPPVPPVFEEGEFSSAPGSTPLTLGGRRRRLLQAQPCPQMCPMNYSPQCGTDGVTYGNECALGVATCESTGKVQLAHPGECDPDDVPGKPKTCKLGESHPAPDGCNTCTCVDEEKALFACTEMACEPMPFPLPFPLPQPIDYCADNDCTADQVCTPEPKQCITQPCPQYRCDAKCNTDSDCAGEDTMCLFEPDYTTVHMHPPFVSVGSETVDAMPEGPQTSTFKPAPLGRRRRLLQLLSQTSAAATSSMPESFQPASKGRCAPRPPPGVCSPDYIMYASGPAFPTGPVDPMMQTAGQALAEESASPACKQCVYKADAYCSANPWDRGCVALTHGCCAAECGKDTPVPAAGPSLQACNQCVKKTDMWCDVTKGQWDMPCVNAAKKCENACPAIALSPANITPQPATDTANDAPTATCHACVHGKDAWCDFAANKWDFACAKATLTTCAGECAANGNPGVALGETNGSATSGVAVGEPSSLPFAQPSAACHACVKNQDKWCNFQGFQWDQMCENAKKAASCAQKCA